MRPFVRRVGGNPYWLSTKALPIVTGKGSYDCHSVQQRLRQVFDPTMAHRWHMPSALTLNMRGLLLSAQYEPPLRYNPF